MTNYQSGSDGSVSWSYSPIEGKLISFRATEMRRERTGLHANVVIFAEDALLQNRVLLSYDTFNISRREDRQRLANSAHKSSANTTKEAYDAESLRHDLDLFCAHILHHWEVGRFKIDTFAVDEEVAPLTFDLEPYLMRDAGTILFGPPESGKSWITLLMAQCLANGITLLWPIPEPRPVLFLNLERPRRTLLQRDAGIRSALSLPGESNVDYLHARGGSLQGVMPAVRKYCQEHPMTVLFVDSISHAGMGKLAEDVTANSFVDLMNSTGATWGAIGHTPRQDTTHIFGSIHFEAGEDIGIRVTAAKLPKRIGISLEVVKANDMARPKPRYYALEFGELGLVSVSNSSKEEFPALDTGPQLSRTEILINYMRLAGKASATQASEETGIQRSYVAELLAQSGQFRVLEKTGSSVLYTLIDRS